MNERFDVNRIRKLVYNDSANGHLTFEMDAAEGWLYVSTYTVDDWNRVIDYSCTFPLDEWMLGEVVKAVKGGEVSLWETGECQYRSMVDCDLRWDLMISTTEEEFKYNGWDAFPRGYDIFSRDLMTLVTSLFYRFRINVDDLEMVYLCTDYSMNTDSFSLTDDSLRATINGKGESLDTVPEHLDAIRTILRDYSLHPYGPKELRAMEYGECIQLHLTDRYENSLCLWWGKDRPVWVDDMIKRLYDAMKEAYRDTRTIQKPIDPFLPRGPNKYYLSEDAKKIIRDHLETVGKKLPIGQEELLESWDYIIDRKKHLLRGLCIGKQVDMEELERMVRATEEMEQFRWGILDYERINEILASDNA